MGVRRFPNRHGAHRGRRQDRRHRRLAGLSSLVLAMFALRGALVSRVKLEVTAKHLILHTGHLDRSRVVHRVGEIARVDAINGRLSIRLVNGRGWLDGGGVGPFYFEAGIREDELRWLVRTLREELGLSPRRGFHGDLQLARPMNRANMTNLTPADVRRSLSRTGGPARLQ
jgi:hypothetical protein